MQSVWKMKKSESDSLKKHNSKATSTQLPITYLCAECWIKFHIAFTLSRHNSNDFFDSSSFYLQNMQISHLARSWWIPMYFHRISCFISCWRSAAFFIIQRLHLVNENFIPKIWIPNPNPNQNNFFTNCYWADDKQSKARNSDSKYRQMALVGFDT